MLCPVCSLIFRDIDPTKLNVEHKSPRSDHHPDLQSLSEAAEAKCYICVRLLKVYHAAGQEDAQFLHTSYQLERLKQPSMWILDVLFPSTIQKHAMNFYIMQIKPSAEVEIPWYLSEESMPKFTNHPQVMLWANIQLRTCRRRHQCGHPIRASWLPPRLLDIRDDVVKLLETSDELVKNNYATLSHCWGPDPSFFVLKADNIVDMYNAVPCDRLPKTFQDAIIVAKNLGLTYLWIDSLCILQSGEGSQDDWQRHARLMASIYANCTVNIAADFGTSSEAGLFASRDPDIVKHQIIDWVPGVKYQLFDADSYAEFGNCVLSKRGWVFQERLLSPRVLHYGQDQVYWECREKINFEAQLEMEVGQTAGSEKDIGFNLPDSNGLGTSGLRMKTANDYWLKLVEEYSDRKLTKPIQDKLAALGGVAERMAEISKDVYVAGLFRQGLPKDLLWETGDPFLGRNATRHRGAYRAPSWSWANVDGKVKFPFYISQNHLMLATVRNLSIQLAHADNPYGQVTSAALLIHSPRFGCSLQKTDNDRADMTVKFPNGSQFAFDETWKDGYKTIYFDDSDTDFNQGKQYALLFILSMPYHPSWPSKQRGRVQRGLIVEANDLHEAQWVRSGFFSITCYSEDFVLPVLLLDPATYVETCII